METINDRFRMLRKKCGKTQSEIGIVLGLSVSGVSEIEKGRRNVTEQHLIMLSNWKEYFVNINWLRTGEGGEDNMFLKPQKNDLVSRAAILLGQQDPMFEALVETYSKLNPANREVLLNFGLDFLKNLKHYSENE